MNAPSRERFAQHEPVRGVVIHNQHMQALNFSRRRERHRLTVPDLKWRHEMKTASLANFAFNPDPAAHHAHDALRNCEAQSRAAVLSRNRSVGLRERFENRSNLLRRNAGARIANLKMQLCRFSLLRFKRYVQLYFTRFGEFYSVS